MSFTFFGRLRGAFPVYLHKTCQDKAAVLILPSDIREQEKEGKTNHTKKQRNLRDHGAQREDNNAMFSRGIHNSFKFLPTQSASRVKVLSTLLAVLCHIPTKLGRQ
ncbi:hypothetical protein AV530_003953 [Patagioenas fasciata monilis]|uniref:Uncharacterized protein n=1 Tax=Patagioenas fasciata monilis TaxID=372326 RepID=A0A1V4JVG3_PATFA|nr:hypothetical protein AV530_003953 [Patagioenas fasciata monilis]